MNPAQQRRCDGQHDHGEQSRFGQKIPGRFVIEIFASRAERVAAKVGATGVAIAYFDRLIIKICNGESAFNPVVPLGAKMQYWLHIRLLVRCVWERIWIRISFGVGIPIARPVPRRKSKLQVISGQ